MRVIGVVVREEHSVDAVNAPCDQLQPQLGGRVDEYSRTTVRLDESADARSLIARIRRTAHRTSTTEHGDAKARAGA